MARLLRPRPPLLGRWSRALFAPALLTPVLLAPACSPAQDPEPDAETDIAPPEVAIVVPAPHAVVADTVRVEIEARDDHEVAHVVLIDDGAIVAEKYHAPWVFGWNTEALLDSSAHVLQAIATDPCGNAARSPECPVLVRSNDPPEVTILEPRPGAWIDLDRPRGTWHARALDPDDGLLAGDAIAWSVDGATLESSGDEIAMPDLTAGTHRIAVEARDRWGTPGRAACTTTAFHYPGRAEPGDALLTFLYALQAGDAQAALGVLAPGFRLHAPRQQGNNPGGIETAGHGLEALLDQERFVSLALSMDCGPIERSQASGGEWAEVELRHLRLDLSLACPRNDLDAIAQVEWEIGPSTARLIFFLNGVDAADGWRLVEWWDLHGAVWCGAGGHSWTDLVMAGLEERLCYASPLRASDSSSSQMRRAAAPSGGP